MERARGKQIAQNERFQAKLLIIQGNFEAAMESLKNLHEQVHREEGLGLRLLMWIEGFLDMGDAVRRKKKARQIYKDLLAQRISHVRAIEELSYLYKRQKGGWLVSRVRNMFNVFR